MNNNSVLIFTQSLNTPLGAMHLAATEQGLCLLEFGDYPLLDNELHGLQRLLKARVQAGENRHITQARQELQEYFQGQRKTFDVALQMPGTLFQQHVWKLLTTLPYGQTASYQQQAERLGTPKAVRAVAAANGRNRVAIIVPCHRIIGKDGSLTGYAGGLERKRWLLQHERQYG